MGLVEKKILKKSWGNEKGIHELTAKFQYLHVWEKKNNSFFSTAVIFKAY